MLTYSKTRLSLTLLYKGFPQLDADTSAVCGSVVLILSQGSLTIWQVDVVICFQAISHDGIHGCKVVASTIYSTGLGCYTHGLTNHGGHLDAETRLNCNERLGVAKALAHHAATERESIFDSLFFYGIIVL